jgi:hypothetical protein
MIRLVQRDSTACGPAVAVVAGSILDAGYGTELMTGTWFANEQDRVHEAANRVWPKFWGTTPAGIARAFSVFAPYRWRLFRGLLGGRRDDLVDVIISVGAGLPVGMLIGNVIPRHWILFVEVIADEFRCYEPSSGEMRMVSFGSIRNSALDADAVGFSRPFAFVLPRRRPELPHGDTAQAPEAPRIAELTRLLETG